MAKSIAVLGLGKYGTSLVRTLYEMGADVLAVDKNETLVNEIADYCSLHPREIPPDGEGLHYVKLYRPGTRSSDGSDGLVLDGSICIAERDHTDNMLLTTHPQYTVRITTNLPDYIDVQGCGTYSAGSWTTVGCLPKYTILSLEFGRWTGAFAGERRSLFPCKVTRDLASTAYYEDSGPCMDLVRGVANPLRQMTVAATASGSYVNGTYKALRGYYEDGTPRYHWGIDLYAKEGTKVYSMYSGTIVRIERDHPDRYEDGSFGNIIVTENDVKGWKRLQRFRRSQQTPGPDGRLRCRSVHGKDPERNSDGPRALPERYRGPGKPSAEKREDRADPLRPCCRNAGKQTSPRHP